MGCGPPGDLGTYDPSIVRQRQTEGDTPLHGGGKISTSPEGCQSAVGREVTRWQPRRSPRPKRAARERAARRRSKSTTYDSLIFLGGLRAPDFFRPHSASVRPRPTPREDGTISELI